MYTYKYTYTYIYIYSLYINIHINIHINIRNIRNLKHVFHLTTVYYVYRYSHWYSSFLWRCCRVASAVVDISVRYCATQVIRNFFALLFINIYIVIA